VPCLHLHIFDKTLFVVGVDTCVVGTSFVVVIVVVVVVLIVVVVVAVAVVVVPFESLENDNYNCTACRIEFYVVI
jgi:hypothetical protein